MIEYENLRKANEAFYSEYEKVFRDVLASGWFILGKQVQQFEEAFANYINCKHFVGVACGLDALYFALKYYEFEKDSEIIVPSNTYIATILAIMRAGLKPVLVEPDIETYNIDPAKIEEVVSKNTKAIMLVHLYGKSCDMDPIMNIAIKHDLKVIEDCAQAHGAKYKGQDVGTFGEFGAFSFYPTKNLGALGDGGGLSFQDGSMKEKVMQMRNYGSSIKYHNEIVGDNSRLDEIQAAFLNVKLKKLDEINQKKKELAAIYLENIKSDFILPKKQEGFDDVYHIFNIRHPERDRLKEYLLKKEIKTEVHYPVAPHKQKAMIGWINPELEFPISEEIHNTTLSLPISSFHTPQDVEKVIEALNSF